MKKFFCVILTMFVLGSIQAQSKSLHQFMETHRYDQNVLHLTVPGWIMKFLNEENQQVITNEIQQAVKKCQLLIMDRFDEEVARDYKKLQQGLKQEGYDLLMHIKEGQKGIFIYGLENTSRSWNNLVLMMGGDDDALVLTLNGLFRQDMLDELKVDFNN